MLAYALIGLWGLVSSTTADFDTHRPPSTWADPSAQTAPQGIVLPLFVPKEFPFVTIIPDDGTDTGGGWQAAKANLEFVRIIVPTNVIVWHCPVTVEMPLRTEKMGKVSPKRAAKMSAEIANKTDAGMDHTLPQGIFCDKFFRQMDATFKSTYPGLGAKVTK